MERKKNANHVLITSISKKVPLISAVKKACQKISSDIVVFGADSAATCVGKYFVDTYWQMPYMEQLRIEDFIDYCKEQNISAVIPTRDGELLYFSKYRERLRQHGISVMVSKYEAVQNCIDKLKFYQVGKRLGFPVIPTYEQLSPLRDEVIDDRVVVKDRLGSGTKNIAINVTSEYAHKFGQDINQPIYQPFIRGNELSVDIYMTKQGRTKGAISRKRELIVNGESQITTTIRALEIESTCKSFAESLGLYGHIIFQVIVDQAGQHYVIECNCRFGGASTLSLAAGLDSFYWFLLEAFGHTLDNLPFTRALEEIKLVRYAEDILIKV